MIFITLDTYSMAPDATTPQFTFWSQITVTQWQCNVLGGSDTGTFTCSRAVGNGICVVVTFSEHIILLRTSVLQNKKQQVSHTKCTNCFQFDDDS